MQQFEVEDELVELIWIRAQPKPFESLSFSDALRRVLNISQDKYFNQRPSLTEVQRPASWVPRSTPKKATSPSARKWASQVPELTKSGSFRDWTSICRHLKIDTAGDSARRKLKAWVSRNQPDWPKVPDPSDV